MGFFWPVLGARVSRARCNAHALLRRTGTQKATQYNQRLGPGSATHR
jgi:hypothetical protein